MFGAEGPVCVKARGRSMPGIMEAPERRLQGWLRARGQVAPGRVWGQTSAHEDREFVSAHWDVERSSTV